MSFFKIRLSPKKYGVNEETQITERPPAPAPMKPQTEADRMRQIVAENRHKIAERKIAYQKKLEDAIDTILAAITERAKNAEQCLYLAHRDYFGFEVDRTDLMEGLESRGFRAELHRNTTTIRIGW